MNTTANSSEVIVVGCQSGDEGKGKFTDVLSSGADAVVRFQAGPNTGHKVVTAAGEFNFIQLPAGVLRGAVGVLGNGCVIEPAALLDELAALQDHGADVRLLISETAHVVMPYHRLLDAAMEGRRGEVVATSAASGFSTGLGQLGSTKRGVGPCREDKIARIGIRMVDLVDPTVLRARLGLLLPLKRELLERVYGMSLADQEHLFDVDAMTETYLAYGAKLEKYLTNVSVYLAGLREQGAYVVYEGAQSMSLDVEHGTYPYCSSGYSAAGGVTVGTGSPPGTPFTVVGVVKAYMIQAGGGPLPTELDGAVADTIVERGREIGTVTGRRRRVGWLDLAFVRKAVRVDGVNRLCVTNIDVLAGLDEIKVATHYMVDGQRLDEYPARLSTAARVEPVYEVFEGWPDLDWAAVARSGYDALPKNARYYLEFIADALGVRLGGVSVGPHREHTILVDLPGPHGAELVR